MLYEFIEYEHRLTQNQVLSLQSRPGDLVVCRHGRLWLTEENGPDVLLTEGESHRIRQAGKLLVEPLMTARLQYLPREVASATIQWRNRILQLGLYAAAVIRRVFQQPVGPAVHRSQIARDKPSADAGCHCA